MSTEGFDFFSESCNNLFLSKSRLFFPPSLRFKNVFDECCIHKDVIYRCLRVTDVKPELTSCNVEITRSKVEGTLTRHPTLRTFHAPPLRLVLVIFASVKMFVETCKTDGNSAFLTQWALSHRHSAQSFGQAWAQDATWWL